MKPAWLNLTIEKLLFSISDVDESVLLTLANGEFSSESVEKLGFILRELDFPFSHTEGLSLLWI